MAGRKKKPDWEAIKLEFLKGATVPELVEKWGVNDATLKSRISRGKWREERDAVASIVQPKLAEKVAEVILDEVGEITRRHFDLWKRALDKAETMLDATRRIVDKEGGVFEVPAIDSAKDLREWASAVKVASEGQRLARGLDKKEEDKQGGADAGHNPVYIRPPKQPLPQRDLGA